MNMKKNKDHDYWLPSHMNRICQKYPKDVRSSTEDEVRGHYEKKGWEVRIGEVSKLVEVRSKPSRPWREVGFADEFLEVTGKAAEELRCWKMTRRVAARRRAMEKMRRLPGG